MLTELIMPTMAEIWGRGGERNARRGVIGAMASAA
jgi:hypothetical protein